MIIRHFKEKDWERVYKRVMSSGRGEPMSLQVDVEIICNGVEYVLRVQPEPNRSIAVLQVMQIVPDPEGRGDKEYCLMGDNALLAALLEILVVQGAEKR